MDEYRHLARPKYQPRHQHALTTVTRGICVVNDGLLESVVETQGLDKDCGVPLDSTVSMNMWGLNPQIFERVEKDFVEFLGNLQNPLKDECYIPLIMDSAIKKDGEKVKVLTTDDKWYGVTYREDKESVVNAIKKFFEEGMYEGI